MPKNVNKPGTLQVRGIVTANRLTMLGFEYNISTSFGAAIQAHMWYSFILQPYSE